MGWLDQTNWHKGLRPLKERLCKVLQKKGQFIKIKLQNLLAAPFPLDVDIDKDRAQFLYFLQQQIEITYDLKEIEMELRALNKL